jgi:glycosyltransferase involved in cell wall biosynthesis
MRACAMRGDAEAKFVVMKIAAFLSHPIQYFTPLWQELSRRPGVELTVYYFSRQGLDHSHDPGFGVSFAWDIDLLAGHHSEFLPRRWPTVDARDSRPRALNAGLYGALSLGWDAVFIAGYVHANNWLIIAACQHLEIPVMCWADSTLHPHADKSWSRRLAKRALLSRFVPRISAFLAAGGHTRAYFEHYGASPDRIFIVPCAIDVLRFRQTVAASNADQRDQLRTRLGIPRDKRIVMFCGKLVDWKRPLDVVAAVRALQRSDTVAVVVGDGPVRESLERAGGAVLTGFVNQRDLPLVLALADVLVLSSSFEPYGAVVAEAQAVGVPAVVSDACGCYGPGSVVQDGVSGLVYPVGDVSALTQRLSTLLGDDVLRRTMSEQARLQAETQSARSAADGFVAALQRVVAPPGSV